MSKFPVDRAALDQALTDMKISDISQATIRQTGDIARRMERATGEEFIHMEMGIPGLRAEEIGVEAERKALADGVASIYPNMFGIPQLKEEASRFIKAFIDVDVAPLGCIPTVGSMQGSYATFMLCTAKDPAKDTILFIDPGFPVQRTQTVVMGIKHESFDIYEYRAERLRAKLESYLSKGNVAALVYSNPNNPAWICLTEEELQIIGELATKYDTVVVEDLAYMCMDFRQPLGHPFQAPFQPTVAKYTDNYVMLISGSKIFSYAGQRIAILAISDKLYSRSFPELKKRFGIEMFGDAMVFTFLYTLSSGTSHAAQYALAAMFKAAADGELDFVGHAREYARRAKLTKEIFLRHGFHVVYDKDLDQDVSDGFFYTIGYPGMSCRELMAEMLLYGVCAIALNTTGSEQPGLRICVSQLNDDKQLDMLDERLTEFKKNH